jgi:hypothetical protein
LKGLAAPRHRSLAEFPALARELRQVTKSPVTSAMVWLYWFFRSGCHLSGDEAEVRVGLLRNALWKRLDVEEVFIATDQPRGCRAVYVAVSRYRP